MEEHEILREMLKKSPKGPITKEQEYKLMEEYQRGEDVGTEIIKNYQRYVFWVAKEYARNGNLLDLIQEGNIGLLEAAKRFSKKFGNRFLTYADSWIRAEIRKSFKNSRDEKALSLDAKIHDDSNRTITEILADKKNHEIYDSFEKNTAIKKIRGHLNDIPYEYSKPLQLLFFEYASIEEISKTMNMTHNQIKGRISLGKQLLASKLKKDNSLKEFLKKYDLKTK